MMSVFLGKVGLKDAAGISWSKTRLLKINVFLLPATSTISAPFGRLVFGSIKSRILFRDSSLLVGVRSTIMPAAPLHPFTTLKSFERLPNPKRNETGISPEKAFLKLSIINFKIFYSIIFIS